MLYRKTMRHTRKIHIRLMVGADRVFKEVAMLLVDDN